MEVTGVDAKQEEYKEKIVEFSNLLNEKDRVPSSVELMSIR